jgi:hypothetical protein
MSHNTAVLYIVASLVCIAWRDRRPILMPALGGIFFGLLLNTRPLTAVVLAPPFALMLLPWALAANARVAGAKSITSFVLGGAAMLVVYGLYNLGTTGELLLSGYSTNGDLNAVIGFGGPHSVGLGMQNDQTQMASLLLVFNGWRQIIGLGLVLAAFVMGSRNRWDWTLLACAVSVMAVYTLYESTGLMHGPRYWYEAMPFLILLAARGAEMLAATAASLVARLRQWLLGTDGRTAWAGVTVVYPVVVVLSVFSAYDWLRGDGLNFSLDAVPNSAANLRGFNGANDGMVRALDDADLHNALVLVETCPNWQCYGTVFWKNVPSLDGDVVYARDLANRNAEVFQRYPDRAVYLASYGTGTVSVYGGGVLQRGATRGPEPPLARNIPTSTPAPTATPDLTLAPRQDQRRRDDLELVQVALEEYFAAHGRYPLAEEVQTLCAYSFDSGCALREVAEIPNDPDPQRVYWYQSDGSYYVVYASMQISGDPGQCPSPVPAHLASVPNLYCRRGGSPPSP